MVPMAHAQTPDGETPANEGVCDELLYNSTPGLYGLCVAFCEAQDAEATFDPATGEVTFAEDAKPSNPKLLEIYNRKKDDYDPPMPCVNVVEQGCPCWTDPVEDYLPIPPYTCGTFADGAYIYIYDSSTPVVSQVTSSNFPDQVPSCAAVITNSNGNTTVSTYLELDAAGHDACKQSIQSYCE